MSQYDDLKGVISLNIQDNNNQEITGDVLQEVLHEMVEVLGPGSIAQETGDSVDKAMSQKAVSEELAKLGSYVENPEWIRVITDSKGKVLCGIKADGSIEWSVGVPTPIKEYVADKIEKLSLNSEQIVAFLGDNIQGHTLNELLNLKVDKIEGKSLSTNDFTDAYKELVETKELIENPEYFEVTVDSNKNILEAIRRTLKTLEKVFNIPVNIQGSKTLAVDNKEFVYAIVDNEESVILGIRKDGSVYFGAGVPSQIQKELNSVNEYTETISNNLKNLSGELAKNISVNYIEVADGKQMAYGTFQSEINASPIISDSSKRYIGSHVIKKDMAEEEDSLPIVAFNHDDLPISDHECVSKIYNKYGFKGSFCWVFELFRSKADKESEIKGISRLIAEGHEVGLHSILNKTYWIFNSMYDVKPDGTSNFAPFVSELQGSNQDGTGTNVFGKTITVNTKLTDIGYITPHTNPKIVELTDSENNIINQYYTWYGDFDMLEGLDLNDELKTKTRLQWIEYLYNEWFDSGLGYSSTANTIAERFNDDYEVPQGANVGDYYPDAAHILNGKMVYWGDTTNPNYSYAKVMTAIGFSDDDYQLVGRFKKGLFKGSFSNCNYEALDKSIAVAEKFAQVYFGLNHFTDCHRHGVAHAGLLYFDEAGATYKDRYHKVVDGGNGRFFISNIGKHIKQIDIMLAYGIKQIDQDVHRNHTRIQGPIGMYYGQKGLRNTNLNLVIESDCAGIVGFGNLFKTPNSGQGVPSMDYNTYMSFMDGLNTDWTKWFYEHAGETISRNGVTMYIDPILKQCINKIRSSVGTGKVPIISLDTITVNPSCFQMMELLLRYCKQNGFRVTSLNKAQSITLSKDRDCSGNIFPNPMFSQSVLDYFGNNSTSKDAYIPDGWDFHPYYHNVNNASVYTESINDVDYRVFELSSAAYSQFYTKMYGLKAGRYKFSILFKSNNGGGQITLSKCRGRNTLMSGTAIETITMTTSWNEKQVEFEIEVPFKKTVDVNDGVSQMCDGYEDCVYAIRCTISCPANDTVYIANPTLTLL